MQTIGGVMAQRKTHKISVLIEPWDAMALAQIAADNRMNLSELMRSGAIALARELADFENLSREYKRQYINEIEPEIKRK
jgi:hypothetical protein